MSFENKTYQRPMTDPVEAQIAFGTEDLIVRLKTFIQNYWDEKYKESANREQSEIGMSVIMNSLISCLGAHMYSMKRFGADMSARSIDIMMEHLSQSLIEAIDFYERADSNPTQQLSN